MEGYTVLNGCVFLPAAEPFGQYLKDCLVKPMIVNGNEVLGIEILPFAPALAGCSEEETRQKLQEVVDRINRTLPTCQQIAKLMGISSAPPP